MVDIAPAGLAMVVSAGRADVPDVHLHLWGAAPEVGGAAGEELLAVIGRIHTVHFVHIVPYPSDEREVKPSGDVIFQKM